MEEQRKQFEAKFAQQQKQIEALADGLRQVSERVEINEQRSQLVANE